jgi:hypothetical protein
MKPSDTPERRLERQHRHRRGKRSESRGKRFENWISGINEIAAHGDGERDSFLERALGTGIQPTPYLYLIKNRATEPPLNLDYWGVATSEWLQELSGPQRLAVQAMRADLIQLLSDPKELEALDARYLYGWTRSDWDWSGLQEQMAKDDSQSFEDQAEVWGLLELADDALRTRRRLRLKNGKSKDFDTASSAGPAISITVTRPLQELYAARLVVRVYDLWGDISHHRSKGRHHWDSRALHLGEVSEDEGQNVNRATFKCSIPDTHRLLRVQSLPAWLNSYEPPPVHPPASPESLRPTFWSGRAEVDVKIGLHWIPGKKLEHEHRRARLATLRRMARAPIKLGSPKRRPVDQWQDRAECAGRVQVVAEQCLNISPTPKKPIRFVEGRPVWSDRIDDPTTVSHHSGIVHQVERPPICACLPALAELSKMIGMSKSALAKMDYRDPPIITVFERAHIASLRAHRRSHWRWGGKYQSRSDRLRSTRDHGFLCAWGALHHHPYSPPIGRR